MHYLKKYNILFQTNCKSSSIINMKIHRLLQFKLCISYCSYSICMKLTKTNIFRFCRQSLCVVVNLTMDNGQW